MCWNTSVPECCILMKRVCWTPYYYKRNPGWSSKVLGLALDYALVFFDADKQFYGGTPNVGYITFNAEYDVTKFCYLYYKTIL